MSETPTPETDSVTRSCDETPWTPWVCAGHAKRLERERDEARNFSKELMEKYLLASGKLQRERDEARMGLADALKEWDLARDGWCKALSERDEARMKLAHIEEYGTKEINEAVTLRQELARAMVELNELKCALSSAVEALQLIGTTVKFWEKESQEK